MEQTSLFSRPDGPGGISTVTFHPSYQGWCNAAREFIRAGVEPHNCEWSPDRSCHSDGVKKIVESSPTKDSSEFSQLARAASCHRNSDRWALLYSIAWRMTTQQRHLLQLRSDPQVAKLHKYAKSVARDAHKMKAFVRFRAVDVPGQAEPRFVSWFEPEHSIVEFISGFFQRRFTNMAWSILTPMGCVHWEGGASAKPWFSAGCDKPSAPDEDCLDSFWQVYYKSIFNPARIKIQAMQSEMPQKYWKNLPEAAVIGELVRDANQTTTEMLFKKKSNDILHCGPRPIKPDDATERGLARSGFTGLLAIAERAKSCTHCHLCEAATQTVFGMGDANARLMIVGEQPGDQEDLCGKPFVGPAGQVLMRALTEAGIGATTVYLTNAVKHFKFKPKGRRRIHDKPSADELRACLPWLHAELREIRPQIIIGLGASAAYSLLGTHKPLRALRGAATGASHLPGAPQQIFVTHHPSHALRTAAGDSPFDTKAYRNLVSDLRLVVAALSDLTQRQTQCFRTKDRDIGA